MAEVFAGIATYEWGVFTSANGAREFLKSSLRLLRYKKFRSYELVRGRGNRFDFQEP